MMSETATPAGLPTSPTGMTRGRLIVAQAAILLLLVGSAYDIVLGREHWPFSCYPMYSRIELEPTMTQLRVFGVSEGNEPTETILQDDQYLDPFDNSRLGSALKRIRRLPDGEARLRDALRSLLARYESRRESGRHDGPPLRAMRLYEMTWTLVPRAANADHPDRKVLVAEVVRVDREDGEP